MDRSNAFTIELIKYPNSELGDLLHLTQGEGSKGLQPELKKYDILWFNPENVPKELFDYVDYFEWILNTNGHDGGLKLWIDNKRVTLSNYRTAIYSGEGEEMVLDHYEYLDFSKMTDVGPIMEEESI